MYTTKVIENFSKKELEKGVSNQASWHQEFKDSAYIFAGGLNFEMNEGDISTVFSQFGEIVDVRLIRDKKTGKSKGYCFLAYQDQRSTVLAVDNLNGIELCDRTIRVNHVKNFKPPKEFLEVKEGEEDNEEDDENKIYKPSGPDGRGWGEYRQYTEEEKRAIKEQERMEAHQDEQTGNLLERLQEKKKKMIVDEDERWEAHLMQLMQDTDEVEKQKQELAQKIKDEVRKRRELKKAMKKEKKDKKKEKKKEKKAKKDKKNKKDKERKDGDDDDDNVGQKRNEIDEKERDEKDLDRELERDYAKFKGKKSKSRSSSSDDPRMDRRVDSSDSGSESSGN